MDAPFCPTCGQPLRWVAANNAWGCDRCQQLYPAATQAPVSQPPAPVPQAYQDRPSQPYSPVPAHVQDHPSQPYSPVPAHVQDHPSQPYSPFREQPAAPPAPPKKRSKGLIIGLAAGGVVVIGIIVAVVVNHNKVSRSRDTVIQKTIAALAEGDEDALFALADPKNTFETTTRCEKRASDDEKDPDLQKLAKEQAERRDPEKMEARWKKELSALVRRTKGTKLEVVDIVTEMPPPFGEKPKDGKDGKDSKDSKDHDRDVDEELKRLRSGSDSLRVRDRDDDEDRPETDSKLKLTTYKKGQQVMKNCYAKVPFRQQQVKVAIDVKDGEREFTQRVRFALVEIDGDWYLSFPPSLNVGLDIIEKDLQSWRDKVCKCTDAGCVDDLDEENGRLAYVQYELDREADLPKDMITRIEKIQGERRTCEGTARAGPELVKYKELKTQVCACKDEECGRKLEIQMMEVRRQLETNARRQRVPSFEVTQQISTIMLEASECTRKLMLLKPRIYSTYPTSAELTGGTVYLRGSGFTAVPRTVKVFFGTKEATSAKITDNYEIAVEAPPGDAEGFIEVRAEFDPGGVVTVPYGFTYKPAKPGTKPKITLPKP